MEHYVGLDVSLQMTAVCVIDERGRGVLEGKVPSEPAAIAAFLQPYAETLAVAGLEAGLLAPYLYSGLVECGGTRVIWCANGRSTSLAGASALTPGAKTSTWRQS